MIDFCFTIIGWLLIHVAPVVCPTGCTEECGSFYKPLLVRLGVATQAEQEEQAMAAAFKNMGLKRVKQT